MSERPEPLSAEAEALLEQLGAGMNPSAADEARAFDRLSEGIAAAEAPRASFSRRVVTFFRGFGQHMWRLAIPLALLLGAIFVTRALTKNELGSATQLESARGLLAQGRPRAAYKVLQQHSEEFKTRSAAEERTPLVLDALCGMGDRDKAQAYLDRFLEAAPDSELADRQRDVCPLGTEPQRRLEEPE